MANLPRRLRFYFQTIPTLNLIMRVLLVAGPVNSSPVIASTAIQFSAMMMMMMMKKQAIETIQCLLIHSHRLFRFDFWGPRGRWNLFITWATGLGEPLSVEFVHNEWKCSNITLYDMKYT